MTNEDLRNDYHNEQGISWDDLEGYPDIDYVEWLESKLLAVKNIAVSPNVIGSLPSSEIEKQI
jgi:hypothetical protein